MFSKACRPPAGPLWPNNQSIRLGFLNSPLSRDVKRGNLCAQLGDLGRAFFRKLFLSQAVEWYICRLLLSGIAGAMAGFGLGDSGYWPLSEGSEQVRGHL